MIGKAGKALRSLVLYQKGKGWWGTTEEPWECVKSNGLDIHLGGSVDESW